MEQITTIIKSRQAIEANIKHLDAEERRLQRELSDLTLERESHARYLGFLISVIYFT
jgi:hypothetical protein